MQKPSLRRPAQQKVCLSVKGATSFSGAAPARRSCRTTTIQSLICCILAEYNREGKDTFSKRSTTPSKIISKEKYKCGLSFIILIDRCYCNIMRARPSGARYITVSTGVYSTWLG